MAQAVYGVESIELAPMGVNGAMPTTGWVKFDDIEDDSVSFAVPPLDRIRIRVEDKGGIRFVLPGDTDGATFSFKSLNMEGDKAKILFGGNWDTATKTYEFPANPGIIYLAVRFTSKPHGGQKFQLSIPAAAGTAGIENTFSRTGFVALSYAGEATTPTNAAGEAMSPWGFKYIAAAAA